MSIILGSVTVPASSTVVSFVMPPGYANLTLFQPSQAQSVWVGSGPAVSTANGMRLSSTPLSTETYVGSGGASWYATTGNATAATFSYVISSTN